MRCRQLEHGTRVCLPSDRPHPSGPGETLQVQELPPDSHSPQMAPPDVVHKTTDNDSRRGNSPSPSEGSHPDSRGNSPTMSDSQDSEPDSMATFVRSYTQAGLSKEAAAIAGEARRSSTRHTIPISESPTDGVSGTRLLHIQPLSGKSANS